MKNSKKVIAIFMTAFVGAGALLSSKTLLNLDSKKVEVAKADSTIDTYYNSVNGTGSALLSSVSSRIKNGYDSIGYDGLWAAYKKTDVAKDGKLRDLYSDETHFALGNKQCGSYSSVGDCYNREHTIPQNWWGGGTGAQGNDIFIVWPSDGKINGVRSNYPYGETSSGKVWKMPADTEANRFGSSTNTDYISGTVFEPMDSRKGDMARTYFYAVTRWDNAKNWGHNVFSASGNNGFVQKYLNMLLKWHTQDPVDDFEINRNNEAYKLQKNRNPYIDHPSYVDLIWGGTYKGTNQETVLKGSTVVNGKIQGGTPPTEVHLTQLSCTGQTDSYYVGDDFEIDGTFTASYSNGQSKTVTPTVENMPDMSVSGTQTVRFLYTENNDTVDFELEITIDELPPSEPVELVLSNLKTQYEVGDEFVKPTVELLFSLGEKIDVTSQAQFSEVDLGQAGTYPVTVSYDYQDETFSTQYSITVKEHKEPEPPHVVSLALSNVVTEYSVGDDFVKPTVTATYSDQAVIDVTDEATFTGYDLAYDGDQVVTVTFGGEHVEYTIMVNPVVKLIAIELSNITRNYEVGDDFVKPTVTAKYDDGSTQDVSGEATFSGYDMEEAGRQTVTVTYSTVSISYTINVAEPEPPAPVVTLVSIAVSNVKESYTVGDNFVKPTVTATYSDQTTRDVTASAEFTGFDASKDGTVTIYVSYTEGEATVETSFTVTIVLPPSSGGCSGSVMATSIILSTLSLVGVALILIKRKARD